MGLFGSRRRQIPLASAPAVPSFALPAMQVDEPMPAAKKPRGLFGSAAPVSLDVADVGVSLPPTKSVQGMPRPSYNGPELSKLAVLGAMFQQLGDNQGQLNDLYDREDKRQRGEYDRVMGDLDTLQQREPLDRLTAGMSQEERDLFAVAPEMALKRMYPEPQKLDPIALARLDLDTRRFQFDQQQAGRMTPAQMAQYNLDRMRLGADLGAKQDAQAEKASKVQRSLEGQYQRQQLVTQDIARARALVDGSTTGFLGNVLRNVGGTPAADLAALVDTIGANIGFKELQDMRDNSPTGGALGQVTERELALLQAVVGSLKQSQSEMQFRQNLDRLEQQYRDSMTRIAQAYQADYGVPMPGSPRQQAPSRSAPAARGADLKAKYGLE